MLHYHIDSPERKVIQQISGKIHVVGWCFDDEAGRPADRVFAKVGAREIEFARVNRPDVSRLVKTRVRPPSLSPQEIDETAFGFESFFQTRNGIKRLRIIASFGGDEIEIGQYFVYFNRGNPIEEKSQYHEHEDEKKASDLGIFDEAHYLKRNPDVGRANISPFQHYMKKGWKKKNADLRHPNMT